MPPVRPTEFTAPHGKPRLTEADAGPTVGWQVLGILQFLAAGSLVLALASRVFFPHGYRNVFLQSSSSSAALGGHATVCVAHQWPGKGTRITKVRPRTLFRPSSSVASVARDERSQIFSLYSAAQSPRAPPASSKARELGMTREENNQLRARFHFAGRSL
jgi:hypothetical protein